MSTFYFTVHPTDMVRARMLPGAAIMLVASSCWDMGRRRLCIRRPPADHISAFVIDSGGFTAARKWGTYPWTLQQYADWLRRESEEMPLAWAASMDYACEREVNRETYKTNLDRIAITIENEAQLRELAPDITWLGVLQGNTLEERAEDIARRRQAGLIHPLMGVGSICGRKAKEAASVLRFYAAELPGVRFHAFGLDIRTLDACDTAAGVLESWDSYAWNWPKGEKAGRPTHLQRGAGNYSSYLRRVASVYYEETVQSRLSRPRQIPLEIVG